MSFGKILQTLRIKKGITQKDVALKLGWKTSQLVSNFERDVCYPPIDCVNELADILECSRDELKMQYIQEKTNDLTTELKKVFKLSSEL